MLFRATCRPVFGLAYSIPQKFRFVHLKIIASQKSIFERGLEGQNLKVHSGIAFGEVWKDKAGKLTAVQLLEVVWRNKTGKLTSV
jgi:hypothetical protein